MSVALEAATHTVPKRGETMKRRRKPPDYGCGQAAPQRNKTPNRSFQRLENWCAGGRRL
jgi:hypothetical protein